jgi:hypothetical protein
MADIEWLLRKYSSVINMVLVREYFELFGMGQDLDVLLREIGNVK